MARLDRRRAVGRVLPVVAGVLVVVAVVFVLVTNTLEVSDALASVVAAVVALATAFVAVVGMLWRPVPVVDVAAEAAALTAELTTRWVTELANRRERFDDPRTIPLAWRSAGGQGSKKPRVLGNNPDAAAKALAANFQALPVRRIVLVGAPGSGKTFAGITLVVGLLRSRPPDAEVPVVLSLSSWDPVAQDLDTWIVRSLAAAHYGGSERIPRALLAHNLILPVLDGLDELPESRRQRAVSRINDTLLGNRPVVLTCRATEYAELLVEQDTPLGRAPVFDVLPVDAKTVIAHLANAPHGSTGWDAVVAEVRARPHGPVGKAFSTPLMLSLFTTAYRDRDPRELLELGPHPDTQAVTDRLMDRLVDAAYPPEKADKARRRLTYLAKYLHRHEERTLVWWRLADRVLSSWTAVVVGLLVGVAAYVLAWACLDLVPARLVPPRSVGEYADPTVFLLGSPTVVGMVFGGVVAALWISGTRQDPAGGRPGFRRGLRTGALLALLPGIPVLLVSVIGLRINPAVVNVAVQFGILLGVAAVSGLAVGLHQFLLSRSLARPGSAAPVELLRRERRTTLVGVLITMGVVGVLGVPVATVFAAASGHIGQRLAVELGQPIVVNLRPPDLQAHVPWSLAVADLPRLVAVSIVLMLLLACAVLANGRWARFVVAKVALAAGGRLPLHLDRFLADARAHGLLRAGPEGYEFWHVLLQDHLVTGSTGQADRSRRPVARLAAVSAAAVLLGYLVVAVSRGEPDDCRATGLPDADAAMTRTVVGGASQCFAVLSAADLRALGVADPDRLLRSSAPVHSTDLRRVQVYGEYTKMSKATFEEVITGLTAAQSAMEPSKLYVYIFVDTDLTGLAAVDVEKLTAVHASRLPGQHGITFTASGAVRLDRKGYHIPPTTDSAAFIRAYRDLEINRETSVAKGGITTDSILRGLDRVQCEALRRRGVEYNTDFKFDLRGWDVTADMITALAGCGTFTLYVDPSQASELSNLVGNVFVTPVAGGRYPGEFCWDKGGGPAASPVVSMACTGPLYTS